MKPNESSRPLQDVLQLLGNIDKTLEHEDINARINILAYGIAGYIVAMVPAYQCETVAEQIGDALQSHCLPVMQFLLERAGNDYASVNRRPS